MRKIYLILSGMMLLLSVMVTQAQTPEPTVTLEPPFLLHGTIQQFSHGKMLWSNRFGVLVIYDDFTWENPTWTDEVIYIDEPAPNTKTMMPHPEHAIGRVWAQRDDIRAKIGWAILNENPRRFIVEYMWHDGQHNTNPLDMQWYIGDGGFYLLNGTDGTWQFNGSIHPRFADAPYAGFDDE